MKEEEEEEEKANVRESIFSFALLSPNASMQGWDFIEGDFKSEGDTHTLRHHKRLDFEIAAHFLIRFRKLLYRKTFFPTATLGDSIT